jgi:cell division protein FtsN
MARDYKDRGTYAKRRTAKDNQKSNLRWILVGIVIAAFAVFLGYLKYSSIEEAKTLAETTSTPTKNAAISKKPVAEDKPKGPKFDFYEILPKGEIIVDEHEIKARITEERNGTTRSAHYILQAGSFENYSDAEKLKTDLARTGVPSKIQKARIGDAIMHRVILGPYAQVTSIETIQAKLRKQKINAMVTELEKQNTGKSNAAKR